LTGPVFSSSGTIALHVAVTDDPKITGTPFATRPLASWSVVCGTDWSSRKLNLTGRPAMPPCPLTVLSKTCSAIFSCVPRNAAPPVSGITAFSSTGLPVGAEASMSITLASVNAMLKSRRTFQRIGFIAFSLG
jgi:hypothetical protein